MHASKSAKAEYNERCLRPNKMSATIDALVHAGRQGWIKQSLSNILRTYALVRQHHLAPLK